MNVKDLMGKMKRRARLRVVNVVQKAKLAVKRTVFQVTGVRQFRWISQRDSRVRSLHRKLDGQIFDLSTGHPTEGFPGEPFGCRCVMEAIPSPKWV